MLDFLQAMVRSSRVRVKDARGRIPEGALLRRARDTEPPPPLRLDGRFHVIAEVKRRAPSSGSPRDPGEAEGVELPRRLALAYERGGAVAISVLTEPAAFGGSPKDLTTVADAVGLPALRKDFVVDPYQLAEARICGASGILLVMRILDPATLDEMLSAAAELGLFVLLEAFDEVDLERAGIAAERAAELGVKALVGINARDLATLEVDVDRLHRLADRFPAGVPRVAESGFGTPAAVADAAGLGYDAALIGAALVRHPRPAELLAAMLRAARAAAGRKVAS